MKFPFVTRAHHEEVVHLLRSQIRGLARTLYAGEVPEEFQMLLGIEIPKPTNPVPEPKAAEPVLTQDQKIEAEAEERQMDAKAKLASIMRTNPSRLGPALEQVMKQTTMYAARAANPHVAQIFDTARKDALNGK